ncbi:hypothetical protein PG993_000239 [Apiospora rasikravindrae]|uniref:Prokaryotic-type class I peptide chain release factors domain-containing protein n=1 Tax=Apiospora rasikravindrae TaxID=990691 RepID=A0ABR1U8G1_9PEZI
MFRRPLYLLPSLGSSFNLAGRVSYRSVRHQAFDATFEQDELEEARSWYASFNESKLPKGQTSYSRSSGPGGQHVNKYAEFPLFCWPRWSSDINARTESKATTVWSFKDLTKDLPKLLHSGLRASKYYAARTDSISIQAQTQRSRTANTDENHQKLFEELQKIYRDSVPGETSDKKRKKYEALEKQFNAERLKIKKQQSAKKTSRKASFSD